MENSLRFSTVFILGLAHSGSTLLGRMLGMHPQAIFCGELLRLHEALSWPQERCSCGALVLECAVWQRRLTTFPEPVKTDYRNWTQETIGRFRRAEGKALFVDSSKDLAFRQKWAWDKQRSAYVLLVRDPRGALRAPLENGLDQDKLLRSTRKWMRRYHTFAQRQSEVCHTMFYEDLVTSPEAELQKLCDFLGLNFTAAMAKPDQGSSFHLIRTSRSPYLKGAGQLKTDERWRSVLPPQQTAAIARALGRLPIYRDRYGMMETTGTRIAFLCRQFLRKLQPKP